MGKNVDSADKTVFGLSTVCFGDEKMKLRIVLCNRDVHLRIGSGTQMVCFPRRNPRRWATQPGLESSPAGDRVAEEQLPS